MNIHYIDTKLVLVVYVKEQIVRWLWRQGKFFVSCVLYGGGDLNVISLYFARKLGILGSFQTHLVLTIGMDL